MTDDDIDQTAETETIGEHIEQPPLSPLQAWLNAEEYGVLHHKSGKVEETGADREALGRDALAHEVANRDDPVSVMAKVGRAWKGTNGETRDEMLALLRESAYARAEVDERNAEQPPEMPEEPESEPEPAIDAGGKIGGDL